MLQKNHIIQQTGMLEKLSSGHLQTLKTGVPSILQKPPLVKTRVTHKIPNKAALERFGNIPV
jgi:predicted alpha/beta-fold hydrolase